MRADLLLFDAEGPINPFELDAPELRALIASKRPREIDRWDELGGEEYARAFTAARTMGYDIVGDLQAEFLRVLATPNATGEDFAKAVFPILRRKGWLPDKSEKDIARRLELIYDTNLRTAQAVGRWGRIQKTKAVLPYLYGFTARDSRVRHPPEGDEDHRAFEGILLPVDHPFWRDYFPPLGFRCRCQVVQKSRGQAARLGNVTTESELAERRTRLGKPWGFNPGRNPLQGVQDAANKTNAKRIEGAKPLDPAIEAARALEAFRKDMAGQSAKAKQEFRSPINRAVTTDSIKVEARAVVEKKLTKSFQGTLAHPSYDQASEFRGRSPRDWERAKLSDAFEDRAASAILALKPELDDLSKQIGLPLIRGFKSIPKNSVRAGADMGDGVMGLNPSTFNYYAARVGSTGRKKELQEKLATIERELEEGQSQLDEVLRLYEENRNRYQDIRTISDRPGATELLDRQRFLVAKLENLQRNQYFRKRELELSDPVPKPGSKWKPGDGVATRPGGVADFFEDRLDKMRQLLFHEYGHHVHQYIFKTQRRNTILPPLERELVEIFAEYRRNRPGRSPSKYSEKNEKEYFAENFSAYVMGRRDLVDPPLLKLIDRIFKREYVA